MKRVITTKTKTTEDLLTERHQTHGRFADVAATESDLMSAIMSSKNWNDLSVSRQCAIRMVAHKLSRLLNGNYLEPDHTADMIGYIRLFEKDGNQ